MKRKLNDRGFTLLELIVVTTILALCVGLTAYSVSAVSSARVRSCTEDIDALLSRSRISAMYRQSPVYLRLYTNDNGEVRAQCWEGGELISDDRVGGDAITVTVTGSLGASIALNTTGVCIAFDRSTGGLVRYPATGGFFSSDGELPVAIKVSGGSVSYSIVMDPVTGSHKPGGRV